MIQRVNITASDKEVARALHHAAYKEVVIKQFGNWNESMQDEFFENDWSAALFQMICENGNPLGYFGHKVVGNDYHIVEIVIDPKHQNRGIGTTLIKSVIAEATSLGLTIKLQTLHLNQAASLYRRLGFVKYRETDTHILMRFESTAEQGAQPDAFGAG